MTETGNGELVRLAEAIEAKDISTRMERKTSSYSEGYSDGIDEAAQIVRDAAGRLSNPPERKSGGEISMPRAYFDLVLGLLQECDKHMPITGSNFDDDMDLAIEQTKTVLATLSKQDS